MRWNAAKALDLTEGHDGREENDDREGVDPELVAGHTVHEGFHSTPKTRRTKKVVSCWQTLATVIRAVFSDRIQHPEVGSCSLAFAPVTFRCVNSPKMWRLAKRVLPSVATDFVGLRRHVVELVHAAIAHGDAQRHVLVGCVILTSAAQVCAVTAWPWELL